MNDANPVPISKRLVLINSISGVATRVLTVGVFAWVIQYLMKRIPEDELAVLPVVVSVAMILPLLQIVLAGGLSRFITEAYARNDVAAVSRIVASQFPLLVIGGIVAAVVGALLAWNIHRLLYIPDSLIGAARFMMLLVVARIAIGIVLAPFTTGLFVRQQFVLQNMIEVCGSLVRIALMLFLILAVGPRVEFVVVAQVVSQFCVLFAQAWYSMRLLPALRYRPSHFDRETCRRVLSFGGWNFVTESASLIRRAADVPILNWFSTPIAVNDFFLGSLFETQLRQMAITATQPLAPALTAMHARVQEDRLAAAYLRGSRIALWASMLLATPLILFGHDLFALYLGSKYAEHVNAANVMVILLIGFPFTYPTLMFFRIAYARGDIGPLAIRGLLSQVLNLALTLLFVGMLQWGALGSAWATLISFISIEPFFDWPLALRTLRLSWRRFIGESLIPGLIPSAVAACVGFLLSQFLPDSSPVRAAVGLPCCLIAYTITLWIVLRPADRADIGRIRQAIHI